jgi:hypothetical protein
MISEPRTILNLLFACLVALGALVAVSSASAAIEKATIDSEKALKKITGGWFDSQSGTYRPPVLSKPIDDTIRKSGWLGKQKLPKPARTGPNWNWANLGLSGELFGWIVFGVLGSVLLFGLIAIAYYYFGDYMPTFRRKSSAKDAIKVDMTKVEDLPFEVPTTNDDPLSYAESLMRAGRYNEAVVYLYGYMLLALDHSRKIHLQKGKTNRMYLREIRSELQLQAIVSKTMLAFEDVFFGRYDIDRARFEMLWQQRDEFHRLIRPAGDEVVAPVPKVAAI